MTRFVQVFAVPDITAMTIARVFVENICLQFGIPSTLLSDNGTGYTANLTQEICKLLGVKSVTCTAFHPQGNGLAESYNKHIIAILSHYVGKTQKDWDIYLKYAEFALNTSVSHSLGDSPFYLMYLTDVTMLLENVLECPRVQYLDVEDYKTIMQRCFVEAFESTKQNLENAKECQKLQFHKNAKEIAYHIGDLVYVHNPMIKKGLVKKLAHQYEGPFRILDANLPNVLIRPANKRTAKPKWKHLGLAVHPTPWRRMNCQTYNILRLGYIY